MTNKNELPADAISSYEQAIRPTNTEINSYMQTPPIRPTAATTQQTTSQNTPASSEKK